MESGIRFLWRVYVIFLAGLLTFCYWAPGLFVLCALRDNMNEISGDVSEITWAHAVNSKDELEKALAGYIDILEADVSLGHVIGNEQGLPEPIMAHPPETTSDISLEIWLKTVVTKRPEKGVKLDFKSIEVLEPALIILQRYSTMLNGSLWLNADVLPGPVHPTATSIPSDYFLAMCSRYIHSKTATLSLGWTTRWIRRYPINWWQYEWKHVRQMVDALKCWYKNAPASIPPVTFNVRAIYASRSIKQLQWLLKMIPRSTLTVWTRAGDAVNAEDFLRIQKSFPADKVYFEAPTTLFKPSSKLKALANNNNNDALNKKIYRRNRKSDATWIELTHKNDTTCEAQTYASEDLVLFGRPTNSAVLNRNMVSFVPGTNFTLKGRLKFFAGEHTVNPADWEHRLNVVLLDVVGLGKHVLSHMTFSAIGAPPDVMWEVMNSSVVYTFEHKYFNDGTACRMFRLDVLGSNLTFEGWTIPCDQFYEYQTFDKMTRVGVSEVALEEMFEQNEHTRYMFGFHSYGNEYVLVHDLEMFGYDEEEAKIRQKRIESLSNIPRLELTSQSSADCLLNQNLISIMLCFLFMAIKISS